MASWRISLPGGFGGAVPKRKPVAGGEKNALREAMRNRGGVKLVARSVVTDVEDNEDGALAHHEDRSPASGASNLGWLNLEAFSTSAIQKSIDRIRADTAVAPSAILKKADTAFSNLRNQPKQEPREQQMQEAVQEEQQPQQQPHEQEQSGPADKVVMEQASPKSSAGWFAPLSAMTAPMAAFATNLGVSRQDADASSTPPVQAPARKSTGGGVRSALAARGGVVRKSMAPEPEPLPAVLEDQLLDAPETHVNANGYHAEVASPSILSDVSDRSAFGQTQVEAKAEAAVADDGRNAVGESTERGPVAVASPSPASQAVPIEDKRWIREPDNAPSVNDTCLALPNVLVECPTATQNYSDALAMRMPRKSEPPRRAQTLEGNAWYSTEKADTHESFIQIEKRAEATTVGAKKKEGQIRDLKEFWGKSSVGFAGPSTLGAGSKLSVGEAQATLQRLLSSGSSVDFDQVRLLRKQISQLDQGRAATV